MLTERRISDTRVDQLSREKNIQAVDLYQNHFRGFSAQSPSSVTHFSQRYANDAVAPSTKNIPASSSIQHFWPE